MRRLNNIDIYIMYSNLASNFAILAKRPSLSLPHVLLLLLQLNLGFLSETVLHRVRGLSVSQLLFLTFSSLL